MTFDAKEISVASGQPFELYEFNHGINYYRYTTLPHAVDYLNNRFAPYPLSRQNIHLTKEFRKSQVQITAPKDFKVAELFKVAMPSKPVNVKIFKKHQNDTEVIVEWVGRVMDAKWTQFDVTITCESIYTVLQNNLRIRHYSYSCPHVLYGSECGLDENNFMDNIVIDSVSGNVITSAQFTNRANGYYTGGFVRWLNNENVETTRFITSHSGDTITLTQQIPGLIAGYEIKIYAGCKRTMDDCYYKFGNLDNFGGFPFLPGLNPFTSSSSIYG